MSPRRPARKHTRALRTARVNLEDGDPDGAVNRCYYAAFYLASAALHLIGENPKTHNGVQDRFWMRFVQEGTFPKEEAKALRMAFDARQKADYTFISVHDTDGAADLLRDVESFVDEAERLLRELIEEKK